MMAGTVDKMKETLWDIAKSGRKHVTGTEAVARRSRANEIVAQWSTEFRNQNAIHSETSEKLDEYVKEFGYYYYLRDHGGANSPPMDGAEFAFVHRVPTQVWIPPEAVVELMANKDGLQNGIKQFGQHAIRNCLHSYLDNPDSDLNFDRSAWLHATFDSTVAAWVPKELAPSSALPANYPLPPSRTDRYGEERQYSLNEKYAAVFAIVDSLYGSVEQIIELSDDSFLHPFNLLKMNVEGMLSSEDDHECRRLLEAFLEDVVDDLNQPKRWNDKIDPDGDSASNKGDDDKMLEWVKSPWHGPTEEPPSEWYGPIEGTKTNLFRVLRPTSGVKAKNPTQQINSLMKTNEEIYWGQSLAPQNHAIYFKKEGEFIRLKKKMDAL